MNWIKNTASNIYSVITFFRPSNILNLYNFVYEFRDVLNSLQMLIYYLIYVSYSRTREDSESHVNYNEDNNMTIILPFIEIVDYLTNIEYKPELKTIKYADFKETDNPYIDNDTCVICFDDYENETIISILQCNHFYCDVCINKWFENNNTCPVCRK